MHPKRKLFCVFCILTVLTQTAINTTAISAVENYYYHETNKLGAGFISELNVCVTFQHHLI